MTKATKEQQEEKREGYVQRLQEVNNALEERHKALLPAFEKALVSRPRDPQSLAKKLSEKYPSLRVVISFQGGVQAVSATPLFEPYTIDPEYPNLEYRLRQAEDALKKPLPSYAEVAAYAEGFNEASVSADDYQELKSDNKRLRSEMGRMPLCHPGLTMMPFGRW